MKNFFLNEKYVIEYTTKKFYLCSDKTDNKKITQKFFEIVKDGTVIDLSKTQEVLSVIDDCVEKILDKKKNLWIFTRRQNVLNFRILVINI